MGPTPPAIFYLLVYIVPITAGIVGGKYLTIVPTFCLMVGVLWDEGVLTMLAMTGEFRPSGFLLGMFVSPGGLVPLLIFLLVGLRVSKRRQSLPTR